jgi:hypothetical protein
MILAGLTCVAHGRPLPGNQGLGTDCLLMADSSDSGCEWRRPEREAGEVVGDELEGPFGSAMQPSNPSATASTARPRVHAMRPCACSPHIRRLDDALGHFRVRIMWGMPVESAWCASWAARRAFWRSTVVHSCATKAAIFDFRSARDCVESRAWGGGSKGKQVPPFPPHRPLPGLPHHQLADLTRPGSEVRRPRAASARKKAEAQWRGTA